MNKDALIAKQQLEIEEYKATAASNRIIRGDLRGHFIAIGQPLNDNRLKFNKAQMIWAVEALELINNIYIPKA